MTQESADDLPNIGKPARRALAAAGCCTLTDVTAWTEQGLLRLHGVGPKAVRILSEALTAQGRSFAPTSHAEQSDT